MHGASWGLFELTQRPWGARDGDNGVAWRKWKWTVFSPIRGSLVRPSGKSTIFVRNHTQNNCISSGQTWVVLENQKPVMMTDLGDQAWVPYRERPEWSDTRGISQDEGPNPVARIAYTGLVTCSLFLGFWQSSLCEKYNVFSCTYTIKISVGYAWQCPGTFAPSAIHILVSSYLSSGLFLDIQ